MVARLAKGPLGDLVIGVLLLAMLEDDDVTKVGADSNIVLLGAGGMEPCKGEDGVEDFDGVEGLDLASIVKLDVIAEVADDLRITL